MISLADQPYVVTLTDNEAADGGDILLLGASGPDNPQGLILAGNVLEWYPLDKIHVHTQLGEWVPVLDQGDDEEPET
jgi:hypothetical protein